MIASFFFMALTTFFAFAFLFYNTTMYSLEDHRKLFARVYLIMLAVLAVGCLLLATKAPDASIKVTQLDKTEFNTTPTFPEIKENSYV